MGWASGGGIFNPVCRSLLDNIADDAAVIEVLTDLIGTLQDGDWDTEDESVDVFHEHPRFSLVQKAFENNDFFIWGTPEYDIRWGENSVEEKRREESEYGDD